MHTRRRPLHRSIEIADKSSVGEARRAAMQIALALDFDEASRSNIGIVATELATNVQLHGSQGELLLCPFMEDQAAWLDIVAIDAGPGIENIGRAMEDGFSTVGTAGQGLGAVARLSDQSSLFSVPGKGTAYWSRFTHGRPSSAAAAGVVNIPLRGELLCGDSWLVIPGPSRSLYMVVDGLGHGSGAAESATEAVITVLQCAGESATEILLRSHDALKKTRGAALSVAIMDHDRQTITYAGVGNVSASLVSGSLSRSLVGQNGTLGMVMPRTPQEYIYPVQPNSVLLMFSDGLHSKLGLSGYPGLQTRPPALIAAVLYRDFTRVRDDATVLVAPLASHIGTV